MMSEILNCIKLIKMYAWEKSFAKAISGMFMLCIQCALQPLYVLVLGLSL